MSILVVLDARIDTVDRLTVVSCDHCFPYVVTSEAGKGQLHGGRTSYAR